MNTIDYIVIAVFSLVIVFAGLAFRKRGANMKSYFAAGGAVPWPMSGLSLFMSFFSAGTFVVWGSIAYELGWVSITIQMTMCVSGFVVAYLIAPAWRKTNCLTAAEFVRDRLGNNIQKFYTYTILVLSLAYAGAFLYPVAKIINVSTGFSVNACIIVLGILILFYTVVGGLWAVIITDTLQFVILSASVLIVVNLSINEVGGFEQFTEQAPEGFFNWTNGDYNWWFIAGMVIFNTLFIGGNWAYVQRYTSVKDPKDAKKVGFTFGWLYLLSPFLWMLPPMIYKVLNPSLSGLENEGAYLLICKQVLPIGILGLMLGGMVFATASSVNTTLNLAASVITNDLYKVLKPNATLEQTMRMAKFSTLLFGVGTITVALLVPTLGGIVNVVLSVGAVTGCSLYGPIVWALYSKRHTGQSIIWITVISLAVNTGLKFYADEVFGAPLSRANEMFWGSVLPLSLLLFYELLAIALHWKSQDYLNYSKLKLIDSIPEPEDAEQNIFGFKVLAKALLIVSILIIMLGILAQETNFLIILIGILIASVSILIHPIFRKKLMKVKHY
jgi:SSS family transporter